MDANAKAGLPERIVGALASSSGLLSAAVVLLGFLAATVLILLTGRNPGNMYSAIIQVVSGWDLSRGVHNSYYVGQWLVSSIPLILCGFSMAFASRTGLFNIGAEGQYVAGLTAAQFAALYGPPIPVLHWVLAVSAGMLAGAAWGGIAGFLKARFNVSEVVATIMMNYIALYASRYLTLRIPGTKTYQTPLFPVTARITSPFLSAITNKSELHYGVYFTLAAVLFYWIVMEKTRLGYSLRAAGFNKDAARYGGINVNGVITIGMAISGAFAGLAGASVSLGVFSAGRVLSAQDGYGFDGIAVALVGNSRSLGVALSGLLFGMLKSAQPLMQSRRIPKEITSIILGMVVVFISLRAGIKLIMDWQLKEKTRKGRPAHD
ncbi:MAG: ABC transporter permease [Treponema sp.]|nr:ABC transporter permease [Treponema sp.]